MCNIDISSHVQLHFLLMPFCEMPIKQVMITNCFASCNSIRFLARVEHLIHKQDSMHPLPIYQKVQSLVSHYMIFANQMSVGCTKRAKL
jgi:hypothetical protein